MKDYKLSEIKEICKKTLAGELICRGKNCELRDFCFAIRSMPLDWDFDIEPCAEDIENDTIKLPYKSKNPMKNGECTYSIIYRDKYGRIQKAEFYDEKCANAFLSELKAKKE